EADCRANRSGRRRDSSLRATAHRSSLAPSLAPLLSPAPFPLSPAPSPLLPAPYPLLPAPYPLLPAPYPLSPAPPGGASRWWWGLVLSISGYSFARSSSITRLHSLPDGGDLEGDDALGIRPSDQGNGWVRPCPRRQQEASR